MLSYLHMVHMLYIYTHTHTACFQINLNGYLALSYHLIQLYMTQHSLQVQYWYLPIAILFLGFL